MTEKNIWASEYECKKNETDSGILLEQKYGTIQDWKDHFEYLLPFFKDERYIKIDQKPVFVFHKANDVHCLENMIQYWNELAKENGFEGLYIIGNAPRKSQEIVLDEVFLCEPGEAMQRSHFILKNAIQCFDYDEIWKNILALGREKGRTIGAFVGYDDTPRHSSSSFGSVIDNGTPEKFEKYITELIQINKKNECQVMFINAWNEWGEVMYLEPDEMNQDEYLLALKNAVGSTNKCDNNILVSDAVPEVPLYRFKTLQFQCEREKHLEKILDKWMGIRENKRNLFGNVKHKKIAVYGCGLLGRHLLAELASRNIVPEFIVDRNPNVNETCPVYKADDKWPDIEVLIVTDTYNYGYIYEYVRKKNSEIEILSLEHMIMDL